MRYIRTPHTIFEVVEENDRVFFVKAKGNPHNIYSKSKCQTQVVKAANTIEELCDELVVNMESEGMVYLSKTKDLKSIHWAHEEAIKKGDTKIYGAIWTEDGLAYTARMNNKGELELL